MMTVWGPERQLHAMLEAHELSEREREVTLLTLAGMRRREIADFLFIEDCTVREHQRRIYGHFGVTAGSGMGPIRLARAIWGYDT